MGKDLFCDTRLRPDIFPQDWSIKKMGSGAVKEFCNGVNPSSHLITKSRMNGAKWTIKKLTGLMRSYDEKWNLEYGDIISVWDVKQTENESPLGFIAFSLSWRETQAKRVNFVSLDCQLLWVRPDKRGLGGTLVRHVVSHFLSYLSACKFVHPNVSLRGIDVLCYADIDTLEGEKAFAIIKDHIIFMKDLELWKIKNCLFFVGD